ncbi:lactate utilization protein [Proteocatella sphenisci]|uniref:lactate utilization protein n=1 Tax=Proteocatella sphenisci TaxID=181070 RepID=UPI000490467B|nr:lactate utilization protein [Proteocatella sphenisci]
MNFKDAAKKCEDLKIQRTIKALHKNNIEGYYAKDAEEAIKTFRSLVKENSVVTAGGSMSCVETGIMDLLRSGAYDYRDRERSGITHEEVQQVLRDAFTSDYFITSTNAITENGELFNIDGNGNRVAAISFGPKEVIVITGSNKIVRDSEEARKRVKAISAPANAMRLDCETPCTIDGICRNCASEKRICCTEVLTGFQRIKNRIKVIIIDGDFGF